MSQSRAVLAGHAAYSELCPDWIEQKLIRAYVQLAVGADYGAAAQTVMLARIGHLEFSLTEAYGADLDGMPPFWLELRALGSGAVIDSIGCHDFDADELAAAVAFVQDAMRRLRSLH